MKKVLVVVDMQKDFITGALRNEDAIRIVPRVVEKVRAAKANDDGILFTLDMHGDGYLYTEEGHNLPVPHCLFDTDGYEIIDELQEYVPKDEYGEYYFNDDAATSKEFNQTFAKGGFGSVELGIFLRKYQYSVCPQDQIQEIELVGVCTDICVISNALLVKAFLPGEHIVVDASCCAGTTSDNHLRALDAMRACHVEIRNA